MRRALRAAAPVLVALVRLGGAAARRRVVGEEHLDAVLARAPSFLPLLLAPASAFCAHYLLRARHAGACVPVF